MGAADPLASWEFGRRFRAAAGPGRSGVICTKSARL